MNVSSVANGQYAAQQSCAGNQTSNFDDVLQEKLQEESQEPSSEPNNEQVGTGTPILDRIYRIYELIPGMPILDIRTGQPLLDSSGQPVIYTEYAASCARIQIEASQQVKRDSIKTPNCIESPQSNHIIEPVSSGYIYDALIGKVGDVGDISVASKLNSMLFSHDPNLETRIADREAGKDIAKYIAENYFDDPEEAQAFMNTINKLAEISEALDKGYVISHKSYHDVDVSYASHPTITARSSFIIFGIKLEKPEPSAPTSDFRSWCEERGYAPYIPDPALREKILNEYNDSKRSMFHAELAAKEKFVQSIIDNVKSTTDVYSNDKWNALMNLLPKAA